MSGPYIGEVRVFFGNFEPLGWAFCEGQLLPIIENQDLFMMLGTTYGGDGQTTFALPDLRGRSPLHCGQIGGGGYDYPGELGGGNTVWLAGPSARQAAGSSKGEMSAVTSPPTALLPERLTEAIYQSSDKLTQLVDEVWKLTQSQNQTKKMIELRDDVRRHVKQAGAYFHAYEQEMQKGKWREAGVKFEKLSKAIAALEKLFDEEASEDVQPAESNLSRRSYGEVLNDYMSDDYSRTTRSPPPPETAKKDYPRFLAVNFIIALEGSTPTPT
jgi:microcystin-dependent protein